jgi:hypothetical protein
VAPAARSSFHRARIAAISSESGRSVFVFVMTWIVGEGLLRTRCSLGAKRFQISFFFLIGWGPNSASRKASRLGRRRSESPGTSPCCRGASIQSGNPQ